MLDIMSQANMQGGGEERVGYGKDWVKMNGDDINFHTILKTFNKDHVCWSFVFFLVVNVK